MPKRTRGPTERAAKKGGGHSNFRTRLAGHTRPLSGHNQATFAWRFLCQKERVTAMEFRVVAIPDSFESYMFEPSMPR